MTLILKKPCSRPLMLLPSIIEMEAVLSDTSNSNAKFTRVVLYTYIILLLVCIRCCKEFTSSRSLPILVYLYRAIKAHTHRYQNIDNREGEELPQYVWV